MVSLSLDPKVVRCRVRRTAIVIDLTLKPSRSLMTKQTAAHWTISALAEAWSRCRPMRTSIASLTGLAAPFCTPENTNRGVVKACRSNING